MLKMMQLWLNNRIVNFYCAELAECEMDKNKIEHKE